MERPYGFAHPICAIVWQPPFALAVAGVLTIMLLQAQALPERPLLVCRKSAARSCSPAVLGLCTSGKKRSFIWMVRTSDHTMLGEIRAMLNRLLDGAAYQQAIETEAHAFTDGELDEIRARVRKSLAAS